MLHARPRACSGRRSLPRAASGATHPTAAGLHTALWITLLITLAATIGGTLLYLLGGVGLPKPDIDYWIDKNRPAIRSPLVAETLRESN